MSICIECGKEYTPFVDGHTLMCDICHDALLKKSNINSSKPKPKEIPVDVPHTIKREFKISDLDLKQLEKYHKSMAFHEKFFR